MGKGQWFQKLNMGQVLTTKTCNKRTTFSQRGVGNSIGFLGFRFGVTTDGRKYWSFGLRGTGLYYLKYYS